MLPPRKRNRILPSVDVARSHVTKYHSNCGRRSDRRMIIVMAPMVIVALERVLKQAGYEVSGNLVLSDGRGLGYVD